MFMLSGNPEAELPAAHAEDEVVQLRDRFLERGAPPAASEG